MALIDGLPAGSLSFNHEHWGTDQELAAETIEMSHAIFGRLGQLVQLTARKRADKVEPLRLPRPEYLENQRKQPKSQRKSRRGTSLGELQEMFGGKGD